MAKRVLITDGRTIWFHKPSSPDFRKEQVGSCWIRFYLNTFAAPSTCPSICYSLSECDCSAYQIPLIAFSILLFFLFCRLVVVAFFLYSQHFAIQNKQIVVINSKIIVEKPNCVTSFLLVCAGESCETSCFFFLSIAVDFNI